MPMQSTRVRDLPDWIPFPMNLHEMNEMYGISDFQFRFKEKCRSTVYSTGRSVALPFLGSIPRIFWIIIIKKKAGLFMSSNLDCILGSWDQRPRMKIESMFGVSVTQDQQRNQTDFLDWKIFCTENSMEETRKPQDFNNEEHMKFLEKKSLKCSAGFKSRR